MVNRIFPEEILEEAAAGGGIDFGFVLLLGEGESIWEVIVNRIFPGGILEEIAGGGIDFGFVLLLGEGESIWEVVVNRVFPGEIL
ncbi:MAG: hypothetical protein LBR92_03650 [Puniceicoccales bacterium]|nr:hypothetical protein [Puniceicoccales bacterium]